MNMFELYSPISFKEVLPLHVHNRSISDRPHKTETDGAQNTTKLFHNRCPFLKVYQNTAFNDSGRFLIRLFGKDGETISSESGWMLKKIAATTAVAITALAGGLFTPAAQADPIADFMRTLPAGSSFNLPTLPTLPGAVPADVEIPLGYRADDHLNWLCTSGSCRKYLSAPELDNMPKRPPSEARFPAWRMSQGFVVTDYYLVRSEFYEDLKYSIPQYNNGRPVAPQLCNGDVSRVRLVKYDMKRGAETATAISRYCA